MSMHPIQLMSPAGSHPPPLSSSLCLLGNNWFLVMNGAAPSFVCFSECDAGVNLPKHKNHNATTVAAASPPICPPPPTSMRPTSACLGTTRNRRLRGGTLSGSLESSGSSGVGVALGSAWGG